MNIDFSFPTIIIGGDGCVKTGFEPAAGLGSCALIMCGKSGARSSGALDDVVSGLNSAGRRYKIYDGVGANPTIEMCEAAALAGKGCDFIIAIGGGSSMDAAKAVAVMLANPAAPSEEIYSARLSALPVVCIGTTAGTGSEANCSSVITNRAGHKIGFANPSAYPRYSYCDPRYTFSLGFSQTVSTALDAFCHSVESLFSHAATVFSECYSEKAIELLFPQLERLARGGFDPSDYAMREILLYGSVLAGRAICFAGTAYPHPAGYGFTEACGLPHGAACALFINDFLKRTAQGRPDMFERLCRVAGGQDRLFAVLGELSENSFTISADFADSVVRRILSSGNFKRSLLEQTEATAAAIVAPFVRPNQAEPLLGEWLFPKKEITAALSCGIKRRHSGF